jgi:hypothetical protein
MLRSSHLPPYSLQAAFYDYKKPTLCSSTLATDGRASPLEIAGFDLQLNIDRLGELAEFPPIRKITGSLTVRNHYINSQKRQLSLFEIIQGQFNSLTTPQSKKSKRNVKVSESQHRPHPPKVALFEKAQSSRLGTSQQPIDVDDIQEDVNSEDDPLGVELHRQRLPSPALHGIQIKGWVEYWPPHSRAANSMPPSQSKAKTPSPLYPPLPELSTTSPFADLNLSPLPSPSPVPSISDLLHRSSPALLNDATASEQA